MYLERGKRRLAVCGTGKAAEDLWKVLNEKRGEG